MSTPQLPYFTGSTATSAPRSTLTVTLSHFGERRHDTALQVAILLLLTAATVALCCIFLLLIQRYRQEKVNSLLEKRGT